MFIKFQLWKKNRENVNGIVGIRLAKYAKFSLSISIKKKSIQFFYQKYFLLTHIGEIHFKLSNKNISKLGWRHIIGVWGEQNTQNFILFHRRKQKVDTIFLSHLRSVFANRKRIKFCVLSTSNTYGVTQVFEILSLEVKSWSEFKQFFSIHDDYFKINENIQDTFRSRIWGENSVYCIWSAHFFVTVARRHAMYIFRCKGIKWSFGIYTGIFCESVYPYIII